MNELPLPHPNAKSGFGARLREVMTARGLGVSAAAKLIGVPASSVTLWITRPKGPLVDSAAIIAEGLGCRLDYLAYGRGKMFENEPKLRHPNAEEALQLRMGKWTPITRNTFVRMSEGALLNLSVGFWINLGDSLQRSVEAELAKQENT